MSNFCDICNKKVGLFSKIKLTDGVICKNCGGITESPISFSVEDIKALWDLRKRRAEKFSQTRSIKAFMNHAMTIDDNNQFFVLGKVKDSDVNLIVYSFSELVGYKIINSNGKVYLKEKSGNNIIIKESVIFPKDDKPIVPSTEIVLSAYGCVRKMNINPVKGLVDFLDECMESGPDNYVEPEEMEFSEENTSNSTASELIALMQMKEQGIISEEEYNRRRDQILGL